MSQLRTPEEKAKIVNRCIDLEMEGGDVLGCLQEEGYVTPKATWQNLQRIYLGRSGDKLTDGRPTGHKRKGKRPEIRQDALDRDRADWERVHETVQTAPEPETVQTEQEPVCTDGPEFRFLKMRSPTGTWTLVQEGEDPVVMFRVRNGSDQGNTLECLSMRLSLWRAMIREFEKAVRLMGLGK